ncbi:TonB family protein [Caviibacterium pharyngocola]|uniref:Protein TonB n=1 Tax=Caviibacterium pharyngocola TaxID=28159 RepID=A0A2M8RVD8_9PAST|nr:energy transducer TonB [Caviibacterium pharyngocola]PJG82856.1 energy transducer TonB [Caviibacterium pharyngocola]
MANKHRSWLGFWLSLLFHSAVIGALFYTVKSDSASAYQAQVTDTNISMEMIMGMVEETPPEPEQVSEPEPVVQETLPDPTVKPLPEKPKEPEKKKEKPKEKPKLQEKPKDKPKEKPKKPVDSAMPKGERTIKSEHKVNSAASAPAKATTDNQNLAGSGASADELNAYRSALRREIERHKRYPQRAKMMRKQGVVNVNFTLGADGGLTNVRVGQSSGAEDLDTAAVAAVQNARSIGPRPKGMDANISVPISFKLQ